VVVPSADAGAQRLSVVIPVLNDRNALVRLLGDLQWLRSAGHQLIVVDGGSGDGSLGSAQALADRVMISQAGRATQMNAGAAIVNTSHIWFLHADTRVSRQACECLLQVIRASSEPCWGRFNVRLDDADYVFRVISFFMNVRSCVSGVATGDQGIFVHRRLFQMVDGFPRIALMEDIALSKQLRRTMRPRCLREPLQVSARRWREHGIVKTVLLMWGLRLLYVVGMSPKVLHGWYYRR
jgi:rSAM/selenodomain-associated transferase 2